MLATTELDVAAAAGRSRTVIRSYDLKARMDEESNTTSISIFIRRPGKQATVIPAETVGVPRTARLWGNLTFFVKCNHLGATTSSESGNLAKH